jgi:glycosyltransferase involved in cell wall biosynthesis
MRILHVITGLKVGGAERMLQKLTMALRERGLEQRVVSLTGLDAIGPELLADGFAVESLGMRSPAGILSAVLRLKGIVRAYRPDILQSWLYHADLVGSLATLTERHTRTVWGVRHSDLSSSANKWSTLAVARCCAWLSGRLPAGILCNSERAILTHEAIGYDRRRMRVIPNGFDTHRFRPNRAEGMAWRARWGVPSGAPLFGWVGRNHPQKAPADFLRAAALLAERRPKAHFVMVGAGIDAQSPGLAEVAADLRLQGRVVYAGSSEEMPTFYSALDAFVSSSLGEGFSNSIAEAMACGVPVIATDAGDSADIVAGSGWVCACGDPAALAGRMETFLAEGPGARAERGIRARAKVVEHWSLHSIGAEFESYYGRISRQAAGSEGNKPEISSALA